MWQRCDAIDIRLCCSHDLTPGLIHPDLPVVCFHTWRRKTSSSMQTADVCVSFSLQPSRRRSMLVWCHCQWQGSAGDCWLGVVASVRLNRDWKNKNVLVESLPFPVCWPKRFKSDGHLFVCLSSHWGQNQRDLQSSRHESGFTSRNETKHYRANQKTESSKQKTCWLSEIDFNLEICPTNWSDVFWVTKEKNLTTTGNISKPVK